MSSRAAQSPAVSLVLMTGIVIAMIAVTYNWGAPVIEKSQTNSKIVNAQEVMSLIKHRIGESALSGEQKSFQVSLDGTLEIVPTKNAVIYSVSTDGLGIGSLSYISLDTAFDAFQYETHVVDAGAGGIVSLDGTDYLVGVCAVDDVVDIDGISHNSGDALLGDPNYVIEHVDCTGLFDGFTVITGPEEEIVGLLGTDAAGVVMAKTIEMGGNYINRMRLTYRELDDVTTLEGYKIIIHSEGSSISSSREHTITIRRESIERIPSGSDLGKDLVLTHIYISIS
ncbi:MAG: hypothetical protein KAJ91_01145 [Candidatus Aenigmarchaeota archaeon]|nr:hypothetical protein [Candidatus Aenigmarchaeota archaeon]MCK5332876.1 hypothetical protein [Candidatus Aenigmarchaeota archaeon]